MSQNLTIILFFAIPILAVIAWAFLRKRKKNDDMTVSTCGAEPRIGDPEHPLDATWFIGPRSKWLGNKSPGMPEHPQMLENGFTFTFPTGAGEKVDYVTFNHGSLIGKSHIRMKFKVEADDGVEILAVNEPITSTSHYISQITPYFQRKGDNWTTKGEFEAYRWYGTAHGMHVTPGEYELIIPLDKGWTGTQNSTVESNPAGFADAKAHAACLGFVFGGNDVGIGHGAHATGRATFTLLDFAVE